MNSTNSTQAVTPIRPSFWETCVEESVERRRKAAAAGAMLESTISPSAPSRDLGTPAEVSPRAVSCAGELKAQLPRSAAPCHAGPFNPEETTNYHQAAPLTIRTVVHEQTSTGKFPVEFAVMRPGAYVVVESIKGEFAAAGIYEARVKAARASMRWALNSGLSKLCLEIDATVARGIDADMEKWCRNGWRKRNGDAPAALESWIEIASLKPQFAALTTRSLHVERHRQARRETRRYRRQHRRRNHRQLGRDFL